MCRPVLERGPSLRRPTVLSKVIQWRPAFAPKRTWGRLYRLVGRGNHADGPASKNPGSNESTERTGPRRAAHRPGRSLHAQGRTGKEPKDEEVHAIIRSLITNNNETRKELEQRGQTSHEAFARLGRENAYLETLLPKTLDQAAIARELQPIAAELKAAKNDGQATGLAVKHLKQMGLAVLGEDVAAAVKQLRAG